MFFKLLSLFHLSAIVLGQPKGGVKLVQHERRDSVPHGFELAGEADASARLKFSIALAQSNITGLKATLDEISDYSSPKYGQWLSPDQVAYHTCPTSKTVKATVDWLQAYGITPSFSPGFDDFIIFTATVDQANALLAADFGNYTHIISRRSYVRTLAYSIPEHLKAHIDYISPTITFIPPIQQRDMSRGSTSSSRVYPRACSPTSMTPSCIQSLYGMPTAASIATGNSIGVGNMGHEAWHSSDLSLFMNSYRSDQTVSWKWQVVALDGGSYNSSLSAEAEASLDMQYTSGFVNGLQVVDYFVGDTLVSGDHHTDLFNHIIAASLRPTVLTVSYGLSEKVYPDATKQRICDAAARLTALGVTIIYSTGDNGCGGLGESASDCVTDPTFYAYYPATCPYITAVGATWSTPEVAESLSGGGFSKYFARPTWQDAKVQAYLSNQDSKYASFQDSTKRAIPDVAAIQRGPVYINGVVSNHLGTSMSAPIFASVVTLLNNELLAAGKQVLGNLNPRLYTDLASAFTDITSGSSSHGCGTGGYSAAAGWDPVTGLGTPSYAKLRAAVGLS